MDFNIASWFTGNPAQTNTATLQTTGSLSKQDFLHFAQLCVRQFDTPGMPKKFSVGLLHGALMQQADDVCKPHCGLLRRPETKDPPFYLSS
jgi:hypothetical protein